jgi:type I restriction enzyme R subunit
MTLHNEIHFETEICEYLAAYGWLYAEGDAQGYDRVRALFPADVVRRPITGKD